jgi:hypothetical protein
VVDAWRHSTNNIFAGDNRDSSIRCVEKDRDHIAKSGCCTCLPHIVILLFNNKLIVCTLTPLNLMDRKAAMNMEYKCMTHKERNHWHDELCQRMKKGNKEPLKNIRSDVDENKRKYSKCRKEYGKTLGTKRDKRQGKKSEVTNSLIRQKDAKRIWETEVLIVVNINNWIKHFHELFIVQ